MIREIVEIGYPFFTVLAFLWGGCLGSFLNVCIYRIPRGMSLISPRSHCPACKQPIAWYDNIPLVSWLVLRGRCRRCGVGISSRYWVVELLTAVLILLVWFQYGEPPRPLGLQALDGPHALAHGLAVFGLLLGGFVDCRHMILPDRVTLGGIVAGLVLSPLIPSLHGETAAMKGFAWGVVGAAFGFLLMEGLAVLGRMVFRKEALGFGDVKLMGAVGAFFGIRAVLATLFMGSMLGALVGVFLILTGKRKLGRHIPFGPYLVAAVLIWMFWGPLLWSGYLRWLGLEGAI